MAAGGSGAFTPAWAGAAVGCEGDLRVAHDLAFGAIPASRRAGFSLPAGLSVIGYDGSTFMSCTDPALTTVRQPLRAIANAPAR